jgi:hypothetical protein
MRVQVAVDFTDEDRRLIAEGGGRVLDGPTRDGLARRSDLRRFVQIAVDAELEKIAERRAGETE